MGKLSLYTNDNLDALRNQSDELADAAVQELIAQPDFAKMINGWTSLPETIPSDFPASLQTFFNFYQIKPDFINQSKVKSSQDFFDQKGNFYLAMLGFYSLPYCYAFADGAQVLVRSKRITDEIGVRLSETALFLLDAFRPGTFISDDRALLTLIKVRLIHAFSRLFVSRYGKDWNPNWGIPINQEDLIGTNIAFSLLVMRGMEKIDKFPGKEVHEAVLHYWKIIGHYLGLRVSFWPETAKEAFELEKLIKKRHLHSSEAGKILLNALLGYYKTTAPDPAFAQVSESLVSFFVGKEVSDVLGIGRKVKLPDRFVNLVLVLSFFRESGFNVSYKSIRRNFLKESISRLGKAVTLDIPVITRS